MRKWISLLSIAAIVLMAASTNAFTYSDMIGDNDGYGYGVADGAVLPEWVFDNRSAAELAATNGAQFTDYESNQFVLDATFDFAPFALSDIISATFTIDVTGIQTTDFGQSRLWFDGIEVADAFAGVEQGVYGSGVFDFAVDNSYLADGNLDVRYLGGDVDATGVDFVKLTIETRTPAIPEPTTLALLGLGLAGLGLRRKLRK